MTDDDVIRIPLRASDGSVMALAIVDREDADLADVPWQLTHNGYARRPTGRRAPYGRMHRLILSRLIGRELASSEQCDHMNRDRLDNRRSNLRIATHGENVVNRNGRGASLYLGVTRNKVKWQARITPLGTGREKANANQIYLGTYATEEEAARAYDRAAREHHGEFARLNFPDGGDA